VGHTVKDTRPLARGFLKQQPWDIASIRRAAGDSLPNHFAAAVALPCRARIMNADLPVMARVSKQSRRGCHEYPRGPIPLVDLDAQSVNVKSYDVPLRRLQIRASREIWPAAMVVGLEDGARCEHE